MISDTLTLILQADVYNIGSCEIRWVFILAVIAACDGLILGALAVTLGISEAKCTQHYYRDISPDQLLQGVPGEGLQGVLSQYHTNMGFTGDLGPSSVYGSSSKAGPGLYMTPYGEDDR